MLNKVILIGRLTKDPENTMTTGGNSITRFTVAVERRYVKKGEERQTDFLNCVSFNKTADFIQKYFVKGQEIVVVGAVQTRSWETDSGEKRYVTEIIVEEVNFCGDKKSNNKNESVETELTTDEEIEQTLAGFAKVQDDDLPF